MFPLDILIYDLAKSATLNLSASVMKKAWHRIHGSLNGLPHSIDELVLFDRTVKEEIVEELGILQKEILYAANLSLRLDDKVLCDKLEITRSKIEKLCRYVNSFELIQKKKGIEVNGLAYLDLIMLSDCVMMLEAAREDLRDLDANNRPKIITCLEGIKSAAKNVEDILLVRSVAATVGERQLLTILQTRAPAVYDQLKDVASFAFSSEEVKKGPFGGKSYLRKIGERSLRVAKTWDETHGPVVSLGSFFLEFQKMNTDITVNHEDIEKSLSILINRGLIFGVEFFEDGNKTVIIRLDCKRVMKLVQADGSFQTRGLSIEELVQKTDWPKDYAVLVLNSMESEDTARKVVEVDSTVSYYFPNLVPLSS